MVLLCRVYPVLLPGGFSGFRSSEAVGVQAGRDQSRYVTTGSSIGLPGCQWILDEPRIPTPRSAEQEARQRANASFGRGTFEFPVVRRSSQDPMTQRGMSLVARRHAAHVVTEDCSHSYMICTFTGFRTFPRFDAANFWSLVRLALRFKRCRVEARGEGIMAGSSI